MKATEEVVEDAIVGAPLINPVIREMQARSGPMTPRKRAAKKRLKNNTPDYDFEVEARKALPTITPSRS